MSKAEDKNDGNKKEAFWSLLQDTSSVKGFNSHSRSCGFELSILKLDI